MGSAARYPPGAIYYLMGVVPLRLLAGAAAVALGLWEGDGREQFIALVGSVLALVYLCTLALGWHRFTVLEEGLHVRDLKGQRVHRWRDLGRPKTRAFASAEAGSAWLDPDGRGGATVPQAFSHRICDVRGRELYRLGPWYPRRRELLREIRRRLRDAE